MKKFFLTLLTIHLSLFTEAKAFSVKHNFDVHIGVFNASKSSFEYALQKDAYFVKSSVKTNGTFGLLYPFKANYFTDGRMEGSQFETLTYHYDSETLFNKRQKELVYDENGKPLYIIHKRNDKEKRKEVKKELYTEGTTDLQTVFAEMAKLYNEMKFCDSKMEVFDGTRRYDIVFKDIGQENLSKNKLSPYYGQAHKCSMYVNKIVGEEDDLLWQVTSNKPVYFWILEEQKTKHPFIARIFLPETPLGELNVYTTKVTVNE